MVGYCYAAADCNSLFSVLTGGMKGVAAEVGDPQLMIMAKMAARQLMKTSQEDKQVGVMVLLRPLL